MKERRDRKATSRLDKTQAVRQEGGGGRETSVTPREAVGASGLRQHEDSGRPRGRKAMFHLKGGGAAEESNQRARRNQVSATVGEAFVWRKKKKKKTLRISINAEYHCCLGQQLDIVHC